MLIVDIPSIPPQAPIIVAAKASVPEKKEGVYSTVGLCYVTEREKKGGDNLQADLLDIRDAAWQAIALHDPFYIPGGSLSDNEFTQQKLKESGKFNYYDIDISSATVKVLQQPKHGALAKDSSNTSYSYKPDIDYVGNDKAVFLVSMAGYDIKVVYYFKIPAEKFDNSNILKMMDKYCPQPRVWLISTAPDGSTPTTGLDSYLATLTKGAFNLAVALDAHNYASPKVAFSNLPGGAAGQTVGVGVNATIALDTNAAGHGWFVDTTPGTNEEFLPTSNPNEWVAKAGSEAAGKMDMLTVLLHEYGHALGLDHSADSHDFMAATLQPGVRHTLSADEQLALMRLTGYFPVPDGPSDPFSPFLGTPLLFGLGRLRGSQFGSLITSTDGFAPQYDVAANPTLTNPEFSGSTGWTTGGDVSFGNGQATLTESATAQTRLNQLFVLGEHDRFLRFTLDGIALDNVNSAPDDAFEVSLIDANTGASLQRDSLTLNSVSVSTGQSIAVVGIAAGLLAFAPALSE